MSAGTGLALGAGGGLLGGMLLGSALSDHNDGGGDYTEVNNYYGDSGDGGGFDGGDF
jgi:hypothetical protein